MHGVSFPVSKNVALGDGLALIKPQAIIQTNIIYVCP